MPTVRPYQFHAESLWPAERLPQVEHDEVAPRGPVQYICPRGHAFEVPFALNVEAPLVWRCRRHGVDGTQTGMDAAPPPKPKHGDKRLLGDTDGRTHYDRVLERRTIPQLQERLAYVQDCRSGGVELV